MPTQLTPTAAKVRSDRAQGRQIYYNQSATDPHGQNDGTWRADCSGLTCAVFDLPGGIDCPSTYELVDSYCGPEISRDQIVPYGTVSITTANDGTGFPFGHVAIVIAYDRAADRIQIQEHGGGTGPDIRWLPAGVAYDSDQKYGRHRPFKLRRLKNVSAAAPATPPQAPAKPTSSHGTPFPYPANEYLGLLTGPNESHGGYNATEKAQVAAIQRVVGVRPDGEFGPLTLAAVAKWQKAHKIPGANSGNVGPLTWKAMGL